MRAAKVPPASAVSKKGIHYVVSAVNACASCEAYQHQLKRTATPTTSSPVSWPFRFTSMLPEDWSALLRMCRRVTHPSAPFNFSSPGDTAASPSPYRSSSAQRRASPASQCSPSTDPCEAADGDELPVQNHAYLHIVERVADDFTPNNMIYHELQKYYLLPPHVRQPTHDEDSQSGDGAPVPAYSSAMIAFTELVTSMQRQPPQAPEDVDAELLGVKDDASAAASAEEKRSLDPLFSNRDAATKSAENVAQLRAYTADLTLQAADAASPSPSHTFLFYPFPVSAAVSIPYCSTYFCVMVNLKPIVPNHLMVVPIRCVGTIHGLTEEEVEDWGYVMRCTIDVLEDLRRQQQQQHGDRGSCPDPQGDGSALGNYSIAVQQGALAGQTVAHLHVHVIPFDPHGKLAGEPETDEEEQRRRPPRTAAMMKAETDALRPLFAKHAAATAAFKSA